ncbi:Replication-associated recombination protein A [Candidatus Magnetomoraceae bacterium gMMP-15]
MNLFEYSAQKAANASKPLAEKMRPKSLDEFIGQDHLVGKGCLIRSSIEKDRIFSMILWGPPGCGKTSLARIIAAETSSYFVHFSAVLAGVKELRSVIKQAKDQMKLYHKKTILFVDEIHRFNKAQQDAFLHHVESGLITLIGATTENPSFEVIPALMSRCRLVSLKFLSFDDIKNIIKKALYDKENGLGKINLDIENQAVSYLAKIADGDARVALNNIELIASILTSENNILNNENRLISLKDIENALQKKALIYDKNGEEHYNLISAFHKSLRGSDPDAALYWMARMISAGEDPLYIARRMVRFASEDVGNADPSALTLSVNALNSYKFLGLPEGELALAQAAAYLATAPKSNSIYEAYNRIKDSVKNSGSLPVPLHIRNAPTRLMKNIGYGKNYKYAHDYKEGYVPQDYLPEKLKGRIYYFPTDRGYEKIIKQRLDKWRNLKSSKKNKKENKTNTPD